MNNTNQIVGTNLKKLRDLFEYTQEGIAHKIGVERSAYGNYEAGLREVPYDVLEKLAEIFGCELHVLFDENFSTQTDVLVCAFRMGDISDSDFEEVCRFKDIVKSYIKMNRIANG